MLFYDALTLIFQRKRLRRFAWELDCAVYYADLSLDGYEHTIIHQNGERLFLGWTPTSDDLFATDWELCDDEK